MSFNLYQVQSQEMTSPEQRQEDHVSRSASETSISSGLRAGLYSDRSPRRQTREDIAAKRRREQRDRDALRQQEERRRQRDERELIRRNIQAQEVINLECLKIKICSELNFIKV